MIYFFNLLFPIYLDYSSTTPVDPRVFEKILPFIYYKFGNYSSKSHIFGWSSNYFIENSRKNISNIINCDSREIIFTSGSTESNNICIKGFSLFYKNKGKHLITLNIEHKSIINCFDYLVSEGFDVTYLEVKKNGLINLNQFNNYIKKNSILISISYVNNELGIIQNINFVSNYCKFKKIILHIDSSQAFGKIFIDLKTLKIDIMSLSSHKLYGPKGCGSVYIRRKSNLYFKNIIHGGGQEKNIRSGTISTFCVIGFSESFSILKKIMFFENLKIKNLKNILFFEIIKIESIYINGDFKYRIPHNLNISFNFIEGESLIISIKNIAVSTGSACSSNILESSYVLKSLNKFIPLNGSIRFTFGRFNKITDLYFLLKLLFKSVYRLRLISPFLNVI
ncbi:Cysteine desulfurase [Candidatus Nasuia deltocephalinicola]|uniref:cysteine desulfurase n=1 Tax=Candidatus Nasuia deltocephalincola TaxID=1160784 RepID=A0A7G6UHS4_9PROT|nr:Cysteine desulfurase [Candidatus Nasuia deltocephalinicola]